MKEIHTTNGRIHKVDDEDYERVIGFPWYEDSKGYARYKKTINGKRTVFFLHRVVTNAPPGQWVDHRNCDRRDSQKQNLRFASPGENAQNARKFAKGTSPYKGVSYDRKAPTSLCVWKSRIRKRLPNRKDLLWSARFENERHAALAYDLWAHDLHGEFARPNFQRAT